MSTRAFGPQSPRHLLARTKHEIGRLARAVGTEYSGSQDAEHEIGSLASTCAGSLWNMVDWLWNSTEPNVKTALDAAGFTTYEKLRDHVKASSPDLTLCWEATNTSKHLELRGHTRKASQIDEAVLSAPVSVPIPATYRFVPKIKTKSGSNQPALEVYQRALSFWEAFLGRVGL